MTFRAIAHPVPPNSDDNRLSIGGNNPPPPTAYEIAREEIEGLYGEAAHWLDGAKVVDQATADGLAKLIKLIRDAKAGADDARKVENVPFDTGKAEVQARYNPLLKKADLALATCKDALAPWLGAIDRAQREAAEEARRLAAEKALAAQQALQAADSANLAERAKAEALVQDAKRADAQANKIEKATATAASGGRAIGLRTTYHPALTDMTAAARHYWSVERRAFEEFLIGLAEKDCRAGRREIPGFTVTEKKTAA